jgi:hypothetical protein
MICCRRPHRPCAGGESDRFGMRMPTMILSLYRARSGPCSSLARSRLGFCRHHPFPRQSRSPTTQGRWGRIRIQFPPPDVPSAHLTIGQDDFGHWIFLVGYWIFASRRVCPQRAQRGVLHSIALAARSQDALFFDTLCLCGLCGLYPQNYTNTQMKKMGMLNSVKEVKVRNPYKKRRSSIPKTNLNVFSL